MIKVKNIAEREIIKNRVYSIEEAAELLGISISTVRRHIKSGILPGNKLGGQYRVMGIDLIHAVRGTRERQRRK